MFCLCCHSDKQLKTRTGKGKRSSHEKVTRENKTWRLPAAACQGWPFSDHCPGLFYRHKWFLLSQQLQIFRSERGKKDAMVWTGYGIKYFQKYQSRGAKTQEELTAISTSGLQDRQRWVAECVPSILGRNNFHWPQDRAERGRLSKEP